MEVEELIKLKKKLFKKGNEIHRSKGKDYAGKEDTLKNFKLVEFLEIVPSELGCYVRFLDKVSRIGQFLKDGVFKVEEESLEDTVIDAINYLCLFYALIVEKRNAEKEG